jgi:hypothetical protein
MGDSEQKPGFWDSVKAGVWDGDFSDDDSWTKMITQTIVGIVPYAGQVADARDTIKAAKDVWNGVDGGWINLAAAGIGWIPAIGDAAKAGIRVTRKGAKAAVEVGGKVAGDVAHLGKNAPHPHTTPDFKGKLRGVEVTLPGVKVKSITYTKRTRAASDALRKEFEDKVRSPFARSLADNEAKIAKLREAGLDDTAIKRLQDGKLPDGWQVHHKIPLDDGGTNSFDNLLLIKNEPYHKTITNAHNELIRGMKEGETKVFDFPVPEGNIYPPKAGG